LILFLRRADQDSVSRLEYILEINDSASGFYGPNEKEDMGHARDLIMDRLNQLESQ
jgi:hypothetical protein